jgi:UDP-GlcNAc:undecaprenyl-phosphate GlcNAc-1-phosphate transferase
MGQSELLAGNLFTALMLPTLALATPIFDTTFVSIVRFLHGRPISQGGRDHTSHRLVMLGLSERRAVCWLYAITLWFGLIALWGAMAKNPLLTIAVTVVSALALIVLSVFLAEVQTYSELEYARARADLRREKAVLSRRIYFKRHFVEAFLDFGLICACWITAFILRFDGDFTRYAQTLSMTLPYIAACQVTAFYFVGLYNGLWRHITISDARTAFLGVFFGTIAASALIITFVPVRFPWSVMVIYALLALLSSVGLRFGLKALRFHFAARWRDGCKRALVVGAGDAGELAVSEMLRNKTLQLQPVGFLDDDPAKHRASIHGVRVLGSRKQLLEVVEKMNVDEVIIAMPSIGNGVVQEVVDLCQANGIEHRQVRGVIL